jgi:large conductance mechanosensitive channel
MPVRLLPLDQNLGVRAEHGSLFFEIAGITRERRSTMLKEFKEFIMRGNVVDLAVGVIVGAAFGAVVKSLVDDIIMPPIGMLLGGVDFTNLFITLGPDSYGTLAEAQEAGAATINYGLFINSIIAFLVVALVVFLLIRALARLEKTEEAAPAEPTTRDCPECLSEIPIEARRCAFCATLLEPGGDADQPDLRAAISP